MTARDWYVVDAITHLLRARSHVWMFDIQDLLRGENVTHPRAFAHICETLRRNNVVLFNSID